MVSVATIDICRIDRGDCLTALHCTCASWQVLDHPSVGKFGELHHHSVVQSAQRALDRENSSAMVADHNWSHKVQMLTGTWFAAYFKLFLGTALFSANALHGLVHVRIIRTDGNSVSKSRFAWLQSLLNIICARPLTVLMRSTRFVCFFKNKFQYSTVWTRTHVDVDPSIC